MIDDYIATFAFSTSQIVGYIALLIILIGLVKSLYDLIILSITQPKKVHMNLNHVRLKLGRYLLLGLEFLIAKDVILTIFDPSLDDLINLGVLIAIRVVLSFFLHRELKDIKLHQE